VLRIVLRFQDYAIENNAASTVQAITGNVIPSWLAGALASFWIAVLIVFVALVYGILKRKAKAAEGGIHA
jgi:hypothetical protein